MTTILEEPDPTGAVAEAGLKLHALAKLLDNMPDDLNQDAVNGLGLILKGIGRDLGKALEPPDQRLGA